MFWISRIPLIFVYFFTGLVFCNVEKVIFTAPALQQLPADASIDNLLLVSLNPNRHSVRTHLNASFPSVNHRKGSESWLLLEHLEPGQRYEVRICWLATQPTEFWLLTHSVTDTLETPSLISSLTSYANLRHASLRDNQVQAIQSRRHPTQQHSVSSLLFLQIYAAADYYSLNKSLMADVPPVLVDIILDPYLLNVLPYSLIPTIMYIILIATGAWFLSAWAVVQLSRISMTQPGNSTLAPGPIESKKSR